MKKFLLLALVLMASVTASASTEWILTKTKAVYQVDTLYHATVGPGTTQTNLRLTGPYALNVFVLTMDMTNPDLELHALKAGNDRTTLATVPTIAKNHDEKDGTTYFAGVNSDFFNMSTPHYTNGNVVANGYYLSPQNAVPWNHWMLNGDGSMDIIEQPTEADPAMNPVLYTVFPGVTTYYTYLDPAVRLANYMCVYTRKNFKNTGTNKWGCEVAIEPVDGGLAEVSTGTRRWRCVANATVPNTTTGMDIPEGCCVLSGNGSAATYISALKEGDEIELSFAFTFGGKEYYPTEMSGFRYRLLTNGTHVDFNSGNDPRTGFGYNADYTKAVMMVIDGRSSESSGAYYRLMAAIMEKLGCYNAVELDGGGSSQMYVNTYPSNNGIVNVPSETPTRKVACGLYAATSVPADDTPASIEVQQKNINLNNGQTFTPIVYAYNKYGVLIDRDVKDFTLEAPATLGTVSADGKTLTANGAGYQPLTVRYGQLTTVVAVKLPGEAGVEDVVVDNDTDTTPEYYNLQGVRVYDPAPGLYIVRQGHSVSKIVIN